MNKYSIPPNGKVGEVGALSIMIDGLFAIKEMDGMNKCSISSGLYPWVRVNVVRVGNVVRVRRDDNVGVGVLQDLKGFWVKVRFRVLKLEQRVSSDRVYKDNILVSDSSP
jgi:hypothetical protein